MDWGMRSLKKEILICYTRVSTFSSRQLANGAKQDARHKQEEWSPPNRKYFMRRADRSTAQFVRGTHGFHFAVHAPPSQHHQTNNKIRMRYALIYNWWIYNTRPGTLYLVSWSNLITSFSQRAQRSNLSNKGDRNLLIILQITKYSLSNEI